MRICYSAADVPIPGTTGGSTHTFELAKALTDLGHEVHVVCKRTPGQEPVETTGGVVLHRLGRSPLGIRSQKPEVRPPRGPDNMGFSKTVRHVYLHTAFATRGTLYLVRLAKQLAIDVFIERGTSFGEATFASIISGRPMILEVIGPHIPPFSTSRATWILAFATAHLRGVDSRKIRIVQAGVNTSVFHPGVDSQEVRMKFDLSSFPVLGYAGSFVQWHDLRALIDAVRILATDGLDLRLLLVGPCPASLRRYIFDSGVAQNVVFTGVVAYEAVPKYLAACDILVAPYHPSLGAGVYSYVKIFEYAAMGRPIITTRGIPDQSILEPAKAAIFVDESNAKQLSMAVRELMHDHSMAMTLGANARLVAEERSWKKYAMDLNLLLMSK